jgi:hypothetical protein
MLNIEAYLDAADEKRRQHVKHTAVARLQTAICERQTQPEPLELRNGDLFLY